MKQKLLRVGFHKPKLVVVHIKLFLSAGDFKLPAE